MITKFLTQLFCEHTYEWIPFDNWIPLISGDKLYGHKCTKCGKHEYFKEIQSKEQ